MSSGVELALADIEEVETVSSKRIANLYLYHGYKILRIDTAAQSIPHPPGATGVNASHYVRRRPAFILGRPSGVNHYDPADDPASLPEV